jgi:hypothetical protein
LNRFHRNGIFVFLVAAIIGLIRQIGPNPVGPVAKWGQIGTMPSVLENR